MVETSIKLAALFWLRKHFTWYDRDGGAGGLGGVSPPHFSRGKMFLFNYEVHAENTRSTCHFTPYPGWVFLEKYLIENVDRLIDCLQSAFSLKIRLVLILSSAIANHDVFYNGCLGFAGSNFAKKNKSPAPSWNCAPPSLYDIIWCLIWWSRYLKIPH